MGVWKEAARRADTAGSIIRFYSAYGVGGVWRAKGTHIGHDRILELARIGGLYLCLDDRMHTSSSLIML